MFDLCPECIKFHNDHSNPQINEARTLDHYRLIALCNVVYKIISKVIANRLKPLLPTLIS
jgi:23S rRNA U2552 (ribose-2'-O)-methylase RlmE/FtsJ